MTTLARLISLLLALALVGCSFLPWVGGSSAWDISIRALVSPGHSTTGSFFTSTGVGIAVAAVILVLGALLNSRALVIIGGLVGMALPSIWILTNAVSRASGIPLSRIQIGAYGCVMIGLMTLILAAVAIDTRAPSTR